MEYKGEVEIAGVKYPVEVRDGERFINNMTVNEFVRTMSFEQNVKAARVGLMALKDEKLDRPHAKGKYQYFMNEPLSTWQEVGE